MEYKEQNQSEQNTSGELDLRIVILFIRNIFRLLSEKKNALTILVSACVFGVLLLAYAWVQPVYYKAESIFISEDNGKGAGLASMMSLASQLGIGAGGSKDNSEKLIEMLKSRNIFENAMMDSAVIEGTSDLIINHYIRLTSFGKGLKNTPGFENFSFRAGRNFTRSQDSIMKVLHMGMHKKGIETISKKSSSMLKLNVLTEHEELSRVLNLALLRKLNEYYIETTVAKQKNMFDILQNRADSIKSEIELREILMAKSTDENMLSFRMEQKVSALRLKREIQVNNLVYAEVIKNVEMARANLLNETPVLTVIDEAVLPLEKEKPAKKFWLLGGLVLGGILAVLKILLSTWWKSMNLN